MKLTRLRMYRVLRVALTVAAIFPRYWWLVVRERWGFLRPSEAEWSRVHESAATKLHDLGVHLAGMFVKVCQVVGARADVFPEPFVRKLRRFHDRVPMRPFAELRGFVERELGRPLDEVFETVDPEPIAAASLAQVHRAVLGSGEHVVLKIQYPEIEKVAEVDLSSLRKVARLTRLLQKRFDLRSIVDEIAKFVALELDFEREAGSTERVAGSFAGSTEVRIPRVHREASTRRILVLEYLDGVKVTDLAALDAAGHGRSDVAGRIARIYATMLFDHGYFHGDPHPGNLLVLPDGTIGLLDFGLSKELPVGFADGVAVLLASAISGRAERALAEAKKLGFEVEASSPEALLRLVRLLLGEKLEGETLMDVIGQSSVAKIPPDFGLIVRTLILLNGLSHTLAPGERLIQAEMARALLPRAATAMAATAA